MENWKPIPGWEQRYLVSDLGRVRSLDMACLTSHKGLALRKGRVLTQVAKGGRYLCVTLATPALRRQYLVHDLVALAFLGPKPHGCQVRHLDDVRTCNVLSNLAYGTHAENTADRCANGKTAKGVRHGMAKLTEDQVRFIRASPLAPAALSRATGVTSAHIHAIRTRRVWRHL